MINLSKNEISSIYHQPLLSLITNARKAHHINFKDDIELCQLISVKTGGCPEDCSYCSQSIHNSSEIKVNPLLPVEDIERIAKQAQEQGLKRICLGAAYKTPNSSAMIKVAEYIKVIKKYNLESCATLGGLSLEQAMELKHAGLDYYNHNLDTSPEYYPQIITSRTFQERVETINNVAHAGIKVCCGGILGLGENVEDRISFIHALTQLSVSPASIPINTLVKIDGTKIGNVAELDKLELIRVIATIRVLFPESRIRLAAGRLELSEAEQTLCFMSGANSIFYGDKLLTTDNKLTSSDEQLLNKLS